MSRDLDVEQAGNQDRKFILKYFLERCGPNPQMLEIGVDTGEVFIFLQSILSRLGGHYTGVDIDFGKARAENNLKEIPSLSTYIGKPSMDFWRVDALEKFWDLIFIDGNHGLVEAFFDTWHGKHHLTKRGWLLLHDTYPAPNDPMAGPYYSYKRLCLEDDRLVSIILPHHGEGMSVCYWKDECYGKDCSCDTDQSA